MKIYVKDQEILLDKDRSIYLTEHKILIISDLHLGKSAHFRQHGIPIPKSVSQTDLDRLDILIEKYEPLKIVVSGDMFHHGLNADIDAFKSWKEKHSSISFILVKGNHDRLQNKSYAELGIELHQKSYIIPPFEVIHEALEDYQSDYYLITGHIHPGIAVKSKSKQTVKLPCFFFGKKYAILPAFSLFTGLYLLKPLDTDAIIAITPKQLIPL